METMSYPADTDLAARLQRLVTAEPWLAMAVILMLTPAQWAALKSQRTFDDMRRQLLQLSAAIGRRSTSGELPEDLAHTVLARLPQAGWLRWFIGSKGSAAGYLNGTMRFQVRDAFRSSQRLKNRRLPPLPDDVPQRQDGDVVERADLIDHIRMLIADMPPEVQVALTSEFEALGGRAEARGKPRSCRGHRRDVAKGIAMLRSKLGIST
jgi:DNA-directed RNA polymerase specialized sigma24 family protein